MSKKQNKIQIAPRTPGRSLEDHIFAPEKCAKMLQSIAKKNGGTLPVGMTRQTTRRVVIGKFNVAPVVVGQLCGLVHRLTPVSAYYTPEVEAAQHKLAKQGRLYHYRTLVIGLKKAGYKIELGESKDSYVAKFINPAKPKSKKVKK